MKPTITIEDRLHATGYKTQRTGDIVQVFDPVHVSTTQRKLKVSHYNLIEIRTIHDAWKFIEERK